MVGTYVYLFIYFFIKTKICWPYACQIQGVEVNKINTWLKHAIQKLVLKSMPLLFNYS